MDRVIRADTGDSDFDSDWEFDLTHAGRTPWRENDGTEPAILNNLAASFDSWFAKRNAGSAKASKPSKRGLGDKNLAGPGKKSYARKSPAVSVKTRSLKSVTSNKLHAAVFPHMRVPITMPNQKGKSKAFRLGSKRGVVSTGQASEVPVMALECPIPGGDVVSKETQPVQKVAWGPASRVETSDHAKIIVKEYRASVKAAKKSKAKRGKGKRSKETTTDTETDDETCTPAKTQKKKDSALSTERDGVPSIDIFAAGEGATVETASNAETESLADTAGTRLMTRGGFRGAPPSTPPDTIFLQKPSAAAAMSMPTLPSMHQIADVKLVEQFRLQHAKEPKAFEQETLDIKNGLILAKVNRGGIAVLLNEEYTVELASREGAEIAEKWSKGQAKTREFPGFRSRAGSLRSQPSSGDLRMRGGEIKEAGPAAVTASKNEKATADVLTLPIPALELSPSAPDDNLTTADPATKDQTKNSKPATKEKVDPKAALRKAKKALSRLNLGDHVFKITTAGSIRHQSSVKSEITDLGERRTIKTWIEVTEVYDIPADHKLTVNDIVTAIEQEEAAKNNGTWESDTSSDSDSDSEDEDEVGEREIRHSKKQGKAKKKTTAESESESSSSSSDSDSDVASDGEAGPSAGRKAHGGQSESEIEGILHSIRLLEGEVNADTISRLAGDLGALMAGLGAEDKLRFSEE